MALFNITIEKVVVKDNDEVKKLLCAINEKLDIIIGAGSPGDDQDDQAKKEIMDKMNKTIDDIKSTI